MKKERKKVIVFIAWAGGEREGRKKKKSEDGVGVF